MMETVPLGAGGPLVTRLGLGLAAVGRPAYITSERDRDLPDRSVDGMRARTHELLDAAYAAGIRYVDVARSYGRAEEFLADWLQGTEAPDLVIGSKWGYAYIGDWQLDAATHEVKNHTIAAFCQQQAESWSLLGERILVYQVHSATLDSGALDDPELHAVLGDLRDLGVVIGVTTSGPQQLEAVRRALDIAVDGEPLFGCVQATWNLLEPSVGPALAEAAVAGCGVIVKEAVANGRLTGGDDAAAAFAPIAEALGTTVDAVAIAAARKQLGVSMVLSGAASVDQLTSNLEALRLPDFEVPDIAEEPKVYWAARAARAWT
jgi:aryl-alcohol dehydrogenase-like predicted oxidoreductase